MPRLGWGGGRALLVLAQLLARGQVGGLGEGGRPASSRRPAHSPDAKSERALEPPPARLPLLLPPSPCSPLSSFSLPGRLPSWLSSSPAENLLCSAFSSSSQPSAPAPQRHLLGQQLSSPSQPTPTLPSGVQSTETAAESQCAGPALCGCSLLREVHRLPEHEDPPFPPMQAGFPGGPAPPGLSYAPAASPLCTHTQTHIHTALCLSIHKILCPSLHLALCLHPQGTWHHSPSLDLALTLTLALPDVTLSLPEVSATPWSSSGSPLRTLSSEGKTKQAQWAWQGPWLSDPSPLPPQVRAPLRAYLSSSSSLLGPVSLMVVFP